MPCPYYIAHGQATLMERGLIRLQGGKQRVILKICGTWRSLVAHSLGVRVVAGSNPAVPTKPSSRPCGF